MYIFYLDNLLRKLFDSYIRQLYVGTDVYVDNPNFLKNLDKLKEIVWNSNIDIPELPKSCVSLPDFGDYGFTY